MHESEIHLGQWYWSNPHFCWVRITRRHFDNYKVPSVWWTAIMDDGAQTEVKVNSVHLSPGDERGTALRPPKPVLRSALQQRVDELRAARDRFRKNHPGLAVLDLWIRSAKTLHKNILDSMTVVPWEKQLMVASVLYDKAALEGMRNSSAQVVEENVHYERLMMRQALTDRDILGPPDLQKMLTQDLAVWDRVHNRVIDEYINRSSTGAEEAPMTHQIQTQTLINGTVGQVLSNRDRSILWQSDPFEDLIEVVDGKDRVVKTAQAQALDAAEAAVKYVDAKAFADVPGGTAAFKPDAPKTARKRS